MIVSPALNTNEIRIFQFKVFFGTHLGRSFYVKIVVWPNYFDKITGYRPKAINYRILNKTQPWLLYETIENLYLETISSNFIIDFP